jgi:hypothetical protein
LFDLFNDYSSHSMTIISMSAEGQVIWFNLPHNPIEGFLANRATVLNRRPACFESPQMFPRTARVTRDSSRVGRTPLTLIIRIPRPRCVSTFVALDVSLFVSVHRINVCTASRRRVAFEELLNLMRQFGARNPVKVDWRDRIVASFCAQRRGHRSASNQVSEESQ